MIFEVCFGNYEIPEGLFEDSGIPEEHFQNYGIPEGHFEDFGIPEGHFEDSGIPEVPRIRNVFLEGQYMNSVILEHEDGKINGNVGKITKLRDS